MNDDINDIFREVKQHALTDFERASMRNSLRAFMMDHPARPPFFVRLADGVSAMGDAFGSQSSLRYRFVPAALALFLVVGVGTSYAAEGAVPGDPLYAVKVGVNEKIHGALALSDAAKTTWHTERIERRLAEAEVLVAEGRLDPVTQAELESHLETSILAFDSQIEKLAMAEADTAVAAAHSDLEASLIGHAEVLVALSISNDNESAAEPIIRSVIARAEKAQNARAAKEARLAATSDDQNVRKAAIEKQEKAKKAIDSVRAKATSALMSATSSAQIAHDAADNAERTVTDAEESLKQGDYGRAFSTFQEAIRNVKTVEVHMDASERLKSEVKVYTRGNATAEVSATLMISTQGE